MRWTALTSAPSVIARLAAVCRSSCRVRSDSPTGAAARSKTAAAHVEPPEQSARGQRNQMTYDLRPLRLIRRIEHTDTYAFIPTGNA
jgi:hypothetical protein